MPGRGGLPILSSRGHTLAWRIQKTAETAAIGLIHQQRLERLLSPELMLVDAELAERARALLREPHEANRKGSHMSALGTHEFTAGTSLGLEPPLSPPVVRGPVASAMPVGDGGISELPSPPPAIRPPEAAPAAPAPASAPVQAEVPQRPEPAAAPAPAPVAAPAPEPVQAEPVLPAMAPEAPVEPAAPVIDYFATDATPAGEPAPVELPAPAPVELPAPAPVAPAEPEAAPAVELHTIPLMAPADPEPAPEPAALEPVVELPAIAPEPEPIAAVEPEPVAAVEPEPVVEPEPAPFVAPPVELAPEPVAEIVPEPVAEVAPEPVSVPELEELFAPKRATDFRVVVRLKEGDGVEVGSFRDFGTAMEGAQEVIEQFSTATDGQWPFYAGRFIRPDLIVSVDVVEGGNEF